MGAGASMPLLWRVLNFRNARIALPHDSIPLAQATALTAGTLWRVTTPDRG